MLAVNQRGNDEHDGDKHFFLEKKLANEWAIK